MVQAGPARRLPSTDSPVGTGMALLFTFAVHAVWAQVTHQTSQIIVCGLLCSHMFKGLSCQLSPHDITTTGFLLTDA